MKVEFNDIRGQYLSCKPAIDAAIARVIQEQAYVRGPYVDAFQTKFAEAHDASHCVGVSNGTDAIYCGLRALGIGPGDEVIVTSSSWIASSEVITEVGATVVFADVEPDYFTICPDSIEAKLTERTRALIVVHLYGQPADMGRILAIAQKHNLHVIEDCAQAHLAEYHGAKVGTLGACGTFSFYPGKNLGAFGDAGAVITEDATLARTMRLYSNHGSLKKPHHEIEGRNSRLDGIQAAILLEKLPHLNDWTDTRIQLASLYDAGLADVEEVQTPRVREGCKHVYHLYVIRAQRRDALREHLSQKGISTGIHYPIGLPFLEAYTRLNHQPSDFPNLSKAQGEILSLPMYPELPEEHIAYVIETIRAFYQ